MEKPTSTVLKYFEAEGVDVVDSISLECPDNLEVAQLDECNLLGHLEDLEANGADAVVISSCVQIPSLTLVQAAEDKIGKPVFSASVATTWDILRKLDFSHQVPGCGTLLSRRLD